MKDNIYSKKKENINDFVFDEKVVNVFDDMIRRSVPGYDLSLSMIKLLASRYIQDNTNLYDLGCSLGAVTLALNEIAGKKGCRIIGVDNSNAMIEKYRENIKGIKDVFAVCADILDIKFKKTSFTVLNFVLQFINSEKRDQVLKSIYNALIPGGIIVISDKLDFKYAGEKEFYTEMHYNFKKAMGYSSLEIKQKRDALENVLVPDTLDTHKKRLHDIGFSSVYICFQCLNFAMIVGVKY